MQGDERGKQTRTGGDVRMSEKGVHKQIQEEEALGREHCQRWAEYILVRKVLHPMGDPHWSRDTRKGL